MDIISVDIIYSRSYYFWLAASLPKKRVHYVTIIECSGVNEEVLP